MYKVHDIFNKCIEITVERWNHICEQHPELNTLWETVRITLENPDFIKMSLADRSVRMYYHYFDNLLGGKYILAVVKTNQRNFLLTAYVTDYIKAGEDLWKRKN